MDLLQVSHFSKYNGEALVLDTIHFHLSSFRRLAIAGETGSGKTTLLKSIAGLVQPDSGEILFEGQKVPGPEEKLLPGHPRIAYLSQHFELRNNYRLHDFLEMASKVGEKEARRIYELCQIDHLLKRKTDQLSGGERQRTALARLLTTSPRLLLLDEPYSNLDGMHKQVLKTVIHNIIEEGATSCIMVSHDPVDVLPWAEEVLVLQEGKIVQKGTPEEVYRQPENEYAGGLFGDYNVLSAKQATELFGWNEQPKSGQVFFRPEKVKLQKGEGKENEGRVTDISFYGSYYEVKISLATAKLLVKTMHSPFQNGDRVKAMVLQEDAWYL